MPRAYTLEQVAAWKKIVDAVHGKGCYMFLQLWVLGRSADPKSVARDDPSIEVVGPSPIATEGRPVPREMTEDEIREYVADYARVAKAFVEEAGGDGVEIHGCHGCMVDQSLQTTANQRTDQYGGSLENRLRFPFEVIKAVTDAVGQERTGIRASPLMKVFDMGLSNDALLETFSAFIQRLKREYPHFAYLHLVSPRASEEGEVDPFELGALNEFAKI